MWALRLRLSPAQHNRGMSDAAGAPVPDTVYPNYLETCRRLGIEAFPYKCALGLVHEYGEVLKGRPEPTRHQQFAPSATIAALNACRTANTLLLPVRTRPAGGAKVAASTGAAGHGLGSVDRG